MDTLPLPIGAVKQAQRPTTIRPAPTPPVQALNPVTLPSPPSPAPLAPLSRGAVTAIGLGVAADGALTLVLLATGWTQGGAHIAGWLAGLMLWLLLAAWAGRGGPAGVLPWTARIGWRGVLAVLALGLRGGVLASALAWGLPAPAAALLGLAAAWAVLIVGERRGLAHIAALPAARRAPAAAGALALAMVLLHLAYLKVFPLLPEEAYYWNYAARPAPGYLDHPPMVAWLIAAAEALAGHGEAVVRLPALLCGAVTAGFVWALARRLVDPAAAGVAAALALALPYAFFLGGLLITPDAPLAASWAAALYFLHRALVSLDARAWVGVGVALGVGMLSKYTIALLGPAALLFCLADARARAWFRRPQPYAAVLLAALLFAPVVWWNHTHDWASFRFQGGERFVEPARFQLHVLLLNVLLVATPLPLLALPLLWTRRWSAASAADSEPAHAEPRNRWFVACFVAVPLAVFALWDRALLAAPHIRTDGERFSAAGRANATACTLYAAEHVTKVPLGSNSLWYGGWTAGTMDGSALAHARRTLRALHDVSLDITARLEPAQVLDVILAHAARLLNAQGSTLVVYGCLFMVGAALVLVIARPAMARGAAVQGVLPLLALVAAWLLR